MPKEKENKLAEIVAYFNGDTAKAADLEKAYHNAFPTAGIPEGAVSRFVDEVFPPNAVQSRIKDIVREHFTPAIKVDEPKKEGK